MDTKQAVVQLNSQLPLKARQDLLSHNLKLAHKSVLRSLVNNGRPATQSELTRLLGKDSVVAGIQKLALDDLVVLDAKQQTIVGAYPVTIEETSHRITVNDHAIYAMCALDAVSVAPVFKTEVQIDSICHVTQSAITIIMKDDEVISADPSLEVRVGVRSQMPTGTAAHSMCLEIVFLLNEQIALRWQNGDEENISLFTLPDAVTFGAAFFRPLLD